MLQPPTFLNLQFDSFMDTTTRRLNLQMKFDLRHVVVCPIIADMSQIVHNNLTESSVPFYFLFHIKLQTLSTKHASVVHLYIALECISVGSNRNQNEDFQSYFTGLPLFRMVKIKNQLHVVCRSTKCIMIANHDGREKDNRQPLVESIELYHPFYRSPLASNRKLKHLKSTRTRGAPLVAANVFFQLRVPTLLCILAAVYTKPRSHARNFL